ncbi:NUDIX domain-containing protein [Natronococcus occultus]|uniref:Translation initiation factor 2B subunit, eIF-2B alpha/beta/delta family n=1 Tax=Natronococcus occultus SP4 TaxID=694430 RepID=L0K2C8_9EURY|nr:NUDIX domain-containing protein [Natronococcus occultus]AGB38253.1 translation initiation factor 2B subunit, eIF-2B alpha/beta/delta family [Natronococcus occultus SP4]
MTGTTNDRDRTHVVTAFLRHDGDVLLLCRSDAVGTYTGRWGGVSGFAEGDPDEQVRTEIREETSLEDAASLVRSGRPVEFADPELDREWVVHPYLFDCEDREVELSEEHDAAEWVPPTDIVVPDSGYETVPQLWTAYERVAPTGRSIAADDEHGAAALSIRALEVVRDRAGLLVAERATDGAEADEEWDELAELARRLLEARPSMAVLRNRVNRTMADAEAAANGTQAGAPEVLAAALAGIDRALEADTEAAATAADVLEGSVMTVSRSGTVLEAIRAGDPRRVLVAESRPAREGVAVAETLAEDVPVTLHTDAAAAHLLATEDVDRVLVGADTIRADGAVVNKTGTRALSVAAVREDVPVTVVAATDKLSTRAELNLESGDRSAVYDGDADLDVANPTFDVTPPDCVTEVATERGRLDPEGLEDVVEELRELEDWRS